MKSESPRPLWLSSTSLTDEKRVHGAVAARLIERDSVSLKLQSSTTTPNLSDYLIFHFEL
jgi:hypothetical protein